MNTEYFILDSLWLLPTKYTDFLRKDWDILFNSPSVLKFSIQERQLALDLMIKNNLILIDDGWCKLSSKGGEYWQAVFQVDWTLFYDCWFDNFHENNEIEQLNFYCFSEDVINLFLEQHNSVLIGCQIESLQNWEATYWKKLESGFYLKHIVSSDFNQIGRIQLPKWKLELDEVIIKNFTLF